MELDARRDIAKLSAGKTMTPEQRKVATQLTTEALLVLQPHIGKFVDDAEAKDFKTQVTKQILAGNVTPQDLAMLKEYQTRLAAGGRITDPIMASAREKLKKLGIWHDAFDKEEAMAKAQEMAQGRK